MCGKNQKTLVPSGRFLGSPPHVREKLSLTLDCIIHCRITPACAGKTFFSLVVSFSSWDHPRMCGKNTPLLFITGVGIGITPACAGKTQFNITSKHTDWDHPRMCGKNDDSISSLPLGIGSPPHVREKP